MDVTRQYAPRFRDREECELFVRFVLGDEATRPPARKTKHQNNPLHGIHIGYQVRCHFRGSDRPDRIYVCIMALRSMGMTINDACVGVAELLQTELGKTRRGRPSKRERTNELPDNVERVRSIFNSRRKRVTWMEMYVRSFRSWRAWVLANNEETFDFFRKRLEKECGLQAVRRWRDVIERVRQHYSGYKDQIDKRWAGVLQRLGISAETESGLCKPPEQWVEAALEELLTANRGAGFCSFRDEDVLIARGDWASFLLEFFDVVPNGLGATKR